jgi:hypothetical protein
MQTVEAVIDEDGRGRLLAEVRVDSPCRTLVPLMEEPVVVSGEAALLAEPALAVDWLMHDAQTLTLPSPNTHPTQHPQKHPLSPVRRPRGRSVH